MSRAHSDIGAAPSWSQPLTECIGSGGFAAVWGIAGGGVLKVAHADHELARARMRREAEALAAIGSPAVPRFRDAGVLADGRAWIAMDRITGPNLGDLIAAGPIGIDQVFEIAEGLLEALSRVHAAGFAHRDLKPDNVVRAPDGSIVLLDLGLARKLPDDPDDPTRAGIQVGSLEYIAPEQLVDAAAAREPADLYAFGCVLYELCAGRPPFLGDALTLERAHAALRPTPLGALAEVPATLAALCLECLAKHPARRPASAAAAARRVRVMRDEPSLHRTSHSRSVIREGKQPVVLLWVELPRVDRTLLGMLAARKVTIISQRGRRVLGGIVGADHADPATAGIAVARDLAAAGARVALHLEPLHVGVGASGPTLGGEAIDHPETWLPGGGWTGVVLTGAIAGVARVRTRSTDLGVGFLRLGEPGELTELFGRDALLEDLTADAAAALAGAGPALALLLGEPGVGKSEVTRALVAPLTELGARVLIATIPPAGSGQPSESALAPIIGAAIAGGPIVRTIGDALRAAARARPTAVVLDDLHLATHELLDALEYATLGGEPLPLWILGVAPPRFEQRRSGFGARAERHRRIVLPPLDGEAAVALTAALLHPAEYPPLRALRQISAIANGNPMHLVTLAREIRERGAIRARPNGEFFLDTTGLETLPTIALGPWLAARELSAIPAELAALARLCAVLGDEVARDEIAAVVERVERGGGATTTIDVDVGLAELEHAKVLVNTNGRWSFRQMLVKEGVYATTNEGERSALHAAALEFWRARDGGAQDAARLARHAEAVGERDVAANAFAVLGARAHATHREIDADQAWEGALRNLDAGDPRLPHALLGRARARYRSQRRIEALADIERVIELATSGDATLEVDALLEQATVLDWTGSFEQSHTSAELARARWAALPEPPPVLTLGVQLAEARSLYRLQQLGEATTALHAVAGAARDAAALDIEIVARLLLGLVLVDTAALDAAERELGAALTLCEQQGDRFHLAVAYTNRARLWSAHGLVDRGADDMRQVIQLAREGGQAQIERVAAYNMAEDLLWQGALDEALRLARRSLALQLGQGEGSAAVDRVLVARILAARQDRAALTDALVTIEGDERLSDELAVEMNGAEHAILSTLRAVAGASGSEAWSAVLSASGSLPSSLQIEVGLLAAAAGQLREPLRTRLVELAKADPIFSGRLAEL